MSNVLNTTKDFSRAVAMLDEHAGIGEGDIVTIDGQNWAGLDIFLHVASNLAWTTRHTVRLARVTKRDVSLMLAAQGASPFTVERHARMIARLVRADLGLHTWSGTV